MKFEILMGVNVYDQRKNRKYARIDENLEQFLLDTGDGHLASYSLSGGSCAGTRALLLSPPRSKKGV